ncbi:MAG TPA: A24 family peptidase [Candidatus Acidoferrales bacterium]
MTIWSFTLALTVVAAWTDLRDRKIPNWLTIPGIFAGIALNSYFKGWHGTKTSLEGAGLALLVLLPLVLLRALGAGDWKLMGAVGAFLGPALFPFVLVASVFVAGLMAIVQMVRTRRVIETLSNLAVLVQGFLSLRVNPEITLDNPVLMKLPFGVAVAAGTLICICAARWGL